MRYGRDLRDDLERLRRTLVPTPSGAQIPMAEIADLQLVEGPAMIRDENGQLAGYVYVDMAGRDVGGYVAEAKARVEQQVTLPKGYSLTWSGQHENMLRVRERLKVVAAPMVGGLSTSFALELLVYPAVYAIWKSRFELKRGRAGLRG